MDFNEIEKYKNTDRNYFDLLNRLMFKHYDYDFFSLFSEAEKQGKKIHLTRDRWKEQFEENPNIDWEDIIQKEDLEIR